MQTTFVTFLKFPCFSLEAYLATFSLEEAAAAADAAVSVVCSPVALV